jgi:hypothetical protein
MWRGMAFEAIAFAGHSLFDHALMGGLLVELGGTGVAIQADGEIVGLVHLDRQLVGAGACLPNMSQADHLGLHGAETALVGMAAIAVLPLNISIFVMDGRHGLASGVLQVINERFHYMARHAKLHVLGLLKADRRAQEHHWCR